MAAISASATSPARSLAPVTASTPHSGVTATGGPSSGSCSIASTANSRAAAKPSSGVQRLENRRLRYKRLTHPGGRRYQYAAVGVKPSQQSLLLNGIEIVRQRIEEFAAKFVAVHGQYDSGPPSTCRVQLGAGVELGGRRFVFERGGKMRQAARMSPPSATTCAAADMPFTAW